MCPGREVPARPKPSQSQARPRLKPNPTEILGASQKPKAKARQSQPARGAGTEALAGALARGGTARPLAARAIDNSKGTPRSVPGTPREFPRILLGV